MNVQSVNNYVVTRNYQTGKANQQVTMPNQQSFGKAYLMKESLKECLKGYGK
jgi:hypothetical protein